MQRINKLLKKINDAKDARRDLLNAAKKAKPTRQAMVDLEGIMAEAVAIFRAETLIKAAQDAQDRIDADTEERDQLLYRAEEYLDGMERSAKARARQHARKGE